MVKTSIEQEGPNLEQQKQQEAFQLLSQVSAALASAERMAEVEAVGGTGSQSFAQLLEKSKISIPDTDTLAVWKRMAQQGSFSFPKREGENITVDSVMALCREVITLYSTFAKSHADYAKAAAAQFSAK